MTALLSIGELSSRTGLPVRTIRFYSDSGVLPPASRTDAGYRQYGTDALPRLGLVRTLRDLAADREGGSPDWTPLAARVADEAGRALAAGVAPGSPEAEAVVAALAPGFGADPGDPAARAALADRLASGTDARAERYWQLLAIV